ncbi:MAG: multicopper oxidase family protein [Myxococcota bacterium]
MGCVAQKVAPEFHWREEWRQHTAVECRSTTHPGDATPRPNDVYQAAGARLMYTELDAQAFVGELVPGWLTRLFGYSSGGKPPSTPGPTIRVTPGMPLVVRHTNRLPKELDLETSVHLHGGHTPAHSDGHPNFRTRPGEARDYYYPNGVPLVVEGGVVTKEWDLDETPTTLWYHDHAEDITAHNALMGLAGFYLCRDEAVEASLPSGAFDVPVALRDVSLCEITDEQQMQAEIKDEAKTRAAKDTGWKFKGEARIYFNPFDHNGTLGNLVLLNGQAYPLFKAERTTYRFRFLNASLARFYRLLFVKVNERTGAMTAVPFKALGRDTWLFDAPKDGTEAFLSMAGRLDLLIDFSAQKLEPWESLYLVNTIEQKDGRGPGHGDNVFGPTQGAPRGAPGKLPADDVAMFLMKIELAPEAPSRAPTAAPAKLRPHRELISRLRGDGTLGEKGGIQPADWKNVPTRVFEFERGQGAWQINKRFYEACLANAVPRLWSLERWILRNKSGGWWHPIHIHLESHQMVYAEVTNPVNPAAKKVLLHHRAYTGVPGEGAPTVEPDAPGWLPGSKFDVTAWNLGIKYDTTILGPNTEVHLLMQFRTFQGPFVFHCHNLNHEDMRMMFQFDPRLGLDSHAGDLPIRPAFWFEEGGKEECK